MKIERFELKSGRFEARIARFEMGINRFEPKIGRFELKTVRFEIKIDRFKPLLTAEGLPWNETKLIAKLLIVAKAEIYLGSRHQFSLLLFII